MSPNYYTILRVSFNATQTDIKSAYRRLAKELHPDHYGEEHAPFQDLQEAYSVLSNPVSRKSYDDSLPNTVGNRQRQPSSPARRYSEDIIEPLVPDRGRGSLSRGSPGQSFYDFRSGFESMYDHFYGNFRGPRQPVNRQSENVTVEIPLSSKLAQSGGNVRLKVPIQIPCPACSRYGNLGYHCRRCHGAGLVSAEETVSFSFPAGIEENHALQFSFGSYHGKRTNLTAIFKIR